MKTTHTYTKDNTTLHDTYIHEYPYIYLSRGLGFTCVPLQNTKMAGPNIPFGAVYLSIAVLIHLKPEYRLLGSSILTFIGLSIIATGFRVFYNLSLYPRIFTPLRHLPTPPVRPSFIYWSS